MEKHKPRVTAIIPARGGSKGIPRKNLCELCGKPLIAYSIEVALKTPEIDDVIVSTEDEEIAEVSRRWGADVPFLRPTELAGDRSNIGDAIDYTLRRLRELEIRPDYVVQLYPTHLFRNPRLLSFLTLKLFEGYTLVKTVRPVDLARFSILPMTGGSTLMPLIPDDALEETRGASYFRPYGLFLGSEVAGKNAFGIYLHPVTDETSLIDIDGYSDLYCAEEIIKESLFDFDLR